MTARRGRGEGSIYQRHDGISCPPLIDKVRAEHNCRGRWVASIDYGKDDGSRDRKVIYGKTKAEVIAKRKEAERRAPARRNRKASTHTVATWMTEWLEQIAAPDLREQTLASHRSKVKQYIIPLIGMHRLDRLEPKHIRRMYARMRMDCPEPTKEGMCRHSPSHGLSESTLRQTHVILVRALKIAVREHLIAENEAKNMDAPGTEQAIRPRLSTAQAKLVLATAANDPYVSRWYAAIDLGMRQGECLGLSWALVNFDEGTITIARTLTAGGRYGEPKSEASRRTIPMTTRLAAHLTVHWAHYLAACQSADKEIDPAALVWSHPDGSPVQHKTDWARWTALLVKAKVPHVTLHSARQTAAAMMEEKGIPERMAAELLGHSDVKQTYRYQRGAGIENKRKAIAALEA